MRLLLDTHVFLWYVTGDAQLPVTFRNAIQDPTNDVFLSVGSVWEAVIKFSIGKLPLPSPPEDLLPKQRVLHMIESLAIDERTMVYLGRLPLLHRDPFDRLLVAQALQHDLAIVTVDNAVRAYPARMLLP